MGSTSKINSHSACRFLLQHLLSACFVLLFSASALAAGHLYAPSLVGTWFTKSQSVISIAPCEEGYCGVLTKVVIPDFLIEKYGAEVAAMEGNYLDALNKDPSLRQRPVLGLKVLILNARAAENRIEGTIYNPEDGETYNGFMELIDNDNIRLSGCVLFNLICTGEDWVRVSSASAAR